jgi:hypothetical protein
MVLEHTLNVKRTDICPVAYYYFDDTLLISLSPLPIESRQILAHLPAPCLNPRPVLAGRGYFDAEGQGRLALRPKALGDPARATPATPATTGHGTSANEKK